MTMNGHDGMQSMRDGTMSDEEFVLRVLQANLPRVTDEDSLKHVQSLIVADMYRINGRMITHMRIECDTAGTIIGVQLRSVRGAPGMSLVGATMSKTERLIN